MIVSIKVLFEFSTKSKLDSVRLKMFKLLTQCWLFGTTYSITQTYIVSYKEAIDDEISTKGFREKYFLNHMYVYLKCNQSSYTNIILLNKPSKGI